MAATPHILDLRPQPGLQGKPDLKPDRPLTSAELAHKSLNPRQIRARARRKMKIGDEELSLLYKPIEDWDNEELARGRPRDKNGNWSGLTPGYVNRAVHEQIVRRFEVVVRQEMSAQTVDALKVVAKILNDEEEDHKGKPRTSAATKLEAAKFLIEHVIGKPKQRIEGDISIKMQQMLGTVLVMPADANIQDFEPNPQLQLAASHLPIDAASHTADEGPDDDPDNYDEF